jgi:hypothetical protein
MFYNNKNKLIVKLIHYRLTNRRRLQDLHEELAGRPSCSSTWTLGPPDIHRSFLQYAKPEI